MIKVDDKREILKQFYESMEFNIWCFCSLWTPNQFDFEGSVIRKTVVLK